MSPMSVTRLCAAHTRESVYMRSAQTGQERSVQHGDLNHPLTHAVWKTCAHGSAVLASSEVSGSRQMVHSPKVLGSAAELC